VKKLIVIAVLFLLAVTGAFAQAGDITDGMFGLPGENYMEVQWYPDAGFEKFYIQAGFTGKADLGFATKIGGLYIGVSYTGGLFHQYDWGGYEESVTIFRGTDKKIKQYTIPEGWADKTWLKNNPNPVDHNFGILIGIADMGFRFDFSSDYQIFEMKEDVIVGGDQYKSYKSEYGTLTPSITWGMAKDLTPNGIRPAIQLSFGFHVDQSQNERYDVTSPYASRSYIGNALGNEGTDNYTDLGLAINLGGYTIMARKNVFTKENEFSFSVDLDYSLNSKLYGKNKRTYSYLNRNANIEEEGRFSSSGGFDGFDTKIENGTHVIEPSLQVQWDSDKIGLGAKLHLPVTIESDKYTYNKLNISNSKLSYSLEKQGTEETISVEFAPSLNLGGVYRLVPSKFHINMGAEIGLSSAKSETVKSHVDATNTDSTKVTNTTKGTDSNFTIGVSFFLTRNVILDAYTGVQKANEFNFFGTGKSSDTETGSVTYFGGILLMLSF